MMTVLLLESVSLQEANARMTSDIIRIAISAINRFYLFSVKLYSGYEVFHWLLNNKNNNN